MQGRRPMATSTDGRTALRPRGAGEWVAGVSMREKPSESIHFTPQGEAPVDSLMGDRPRR